MTKTPTYEGRPLPRPQDELVDQGLAFDLATLVSRRQLFRGLGIGAAAAGLAACGGSSGTTSTTAQASSASPSAAAMASTVLTEIPDETAGPYLADGSNGPDVLSESGVIRSDIRSSFGGANGIADGVPMTLELSIKDLVKGGAAFAGVAVYVWHCDREGRYSMYSAGAEDENYLRGVQVAGADGRVRFTSIFPACYTGRWPHIHFEVYPDAASITDSSTAIAVSQVALPADACRQVYATSGYESSVASLSQVSLQGDNVFGDDGGRTQLGNVTGDVKNGYAVALTVGIDTTTAPSGGGPPSR